ncbi:hypothetical protein SO694_00022439 [Aureococcus anophagefferens]|uniref:BspA family leucine-rich repeat surface protein n=1 Tax=Aureococcus anophagefferens TaxID=44056 RepID=A0ABR1FTA3_AURAN
MYTQDLALPTTTCYERIDFGCGDVNRDNATSILDAVLIAALRGPRGVGVARLPTRIPTYSPTASFLPSYLPTTSDPSMMPTGEPDVRAECAAPSYTTPLPTRSPAPTSFAFASKADLKIAVDAWLADADAAEAIYGHISSWDTSKVTDMSSMFFYADAFNQDLSGWDTSAVTDMSAMFNYASAFNQDIGDWDTSKVTSMNYLFEEAHAFNQDIGAWNTASVTSMSWTFMLWPSTRTSAIGTRRP